MVDRNNTTDLQLWGIGVTPYSARGLTMTMAPIAQAGNSRRTINGALIDITPSQFKKFKLTITCTDQQAPALDGIWAGKEVTVDCTQELAYSEYAPGPSRQVVPGSEREANGFRFYRP